MRFWGYDLICDLTRLGPISLLGSRRLCTLAFTIFLEVKEMSGEPRKERVRRQRSWVFVINIHEWNGGSF